MDLPSERGERFSVRVKPNASRTAYVGYDAVREAHVFSVAAPPDKGKANDALLAHLKKEHGLACGIVAGATSRKKLLEVLDYSSSSSSKKAPRR